MLVSMGNLSFCKRKRLLESNCDLVLNLDLILPDLGKSFLNSPPPTLHMSLAPLLLSPASSSELASSK